MSYECSREHGVTYGEVPMYVDQKSIDWRIFLVGGHSYSGKTTAAKRLGLQLGVPWIMVDDLLLAFQRAGVRLPKGTSALYFLQSPDIRTTRLTPAVG